nr:hypothetical protein [Tanacetum cinerariifolium]
VNSQNSKWGNVGSKGKSNHAGSSYVKKNVGPSPGMSKDDDVESEYDGIAVSMKPEFELDAATNMENGAAHASNVSNAFGCSKVTTAMSDFRDCVADIEVEDISMSGLNFTWNRCPGKAGGLLKKLDRIMVSKLRMLKKPLRKLNFDQGNLFDNVERLKKEPATIQSTMVSNPFSSDHREAELSCLKAFKEALKDE